MTSFQGSANSEEFQSSLDRLYGNTREQREAEASAREERVFEPNKLPSTEQYFIILNPQATAKEIIQYHTNKATEIQQEQQYEQQYEIAQAAEAKRESDIESATNASIFVGVVVAIIGTVFLLKFLSPKVIGFTGKQTDNVVGKYNKKSAYKELHELKALLNKDIITREEFDAKSQVLKQKIL